MQLDKILVPTDLSDEGLRPLMDEKLRESGAEILLLSVVHDVAIAPHGAPLAPPQHMPGMEHERDEAQKATEELAKRFGAEGLNVRAIVKVSTDVADAIGEVAAEENVDLIAISTHGRSGFRRLVLGSVAEKIIRHSKVPVLVFPRH
jgi:nucleotide-binding universal stress UspA family protein